MGKIKGRPKILTLNGPNLNLLGTREPNLYGHTTLSDIKKRLSFLASNNNVEAIFFQSNAEHEIIDAIHNAVNEIDFILINAGAFTHTSIAIRDALLGVSIPFIEIHISNIYAREDFRKKSYLSDIAFGTINGLGHIGYELAMQAAIASTKSK